MLSLSPQLQLARLTLHEILELPVGERMAYIAHSRLLRQQKRERVCGVEREGGREGV